MNFTKKERVFSRAVIAASVIVLVVLALLQYRWSSEVSVAAGSRMKARLQTSMMDFRQDLSRELGAICLEMQPSVNGGAIDLTTYVRRLQHWQDTASHPGLISAVYLWQFAPGEPANLLRLDAGAEELLSVPEPAAFAQLKPTLQTASQQIASAPPKPALEMGPFDGHEPRSGGGGPHFGFPESSGPWALDEQLPALIQHVPASARDTSKTVTWIVVELNTTVLKEQIFPELAERYFGSPNGLVYDVSILQNEDGQPKVIYSSDWQLAGTRNASADAVINLWGPPGPPPPAGPDFVRPVARPRNDEATNVFGERHGPDFSRPARFEPMRLSSGEHAWQLAVRHRKGSVEAAVAEIRRRNLLISFGILLLLGVTIALIVITSQRARELARLQMDFVAGVSHELRTPLAVISSAASNISDGVVADSDQLVQYGNMIQTQAKQLNHLVEQVLQFAATKNPNHSYKLAAVDVADLIDEALANTQPVIDAAGFSVTRAVDPNLPAVKANSAALSQILQNLITNAIKYGGENRWIGIRAFAHTIDGTPEVRVSVEDRGLGIEPQDLEHVFEPFYRSPSVAGSSIHGTGLGLPLAKSMAELMGGKLTAESHVGKGSVFTIHLPAATGVIRHTDASQPEVTPHPNIT